MKRLFSLVLLSIFVACNSDDDKIGRGVESIKWAEESVAIDYLETIDTNTLMDFDSHLAQNSLIDDIEYYGQLIENSLVVEPIDFPLVDLHNFGESIVNLRSLQNASNLTYSDEVSFPTGIYAWDDVTNDFVFESDNDNSLTLRFYDGEDIGTEVQIIVFTLGDASRVSQNITLNLISGLENLDFTLTAEWAIDRAGNVNLDHIWTRAGTTGDAVFSSVDLNITGGDNFSHALELNSNEELWFGESYSVFQATGYGSRSDNRFENVVRWGYSYSGEVTSFSISEAEVFLIMQDPWEGQLRVGQIINEEDTYLLELKEGTRMDFAFGEDIINAIVDQFSN